MSIDLQNLDKSELEQLIADAQKQKTRLLRERKDEVRRKLISIAKEEGYSIEELFGGAKPAGRKTGSVAPKYRNPADASQTWTGRGKRPRWFADALASGKSEDDLKI